MTTERQEDPADVTICHVTESDVWCFWETEYPEDMVIGPFKSEEACRVGVEDFYKHNNPFTSGKTEYEITHVISRKARWGASEGGQLAAVRALVTRVYHVGILVNRDLCMCSGLSGWFSGRRHEQRCLSCRCLKRNACDIDDKAREQGVSYLHGETWHPEEVWKNPPSWLWRVKDVEWWPSEP